MKTHNVHKTFISLQYSIFVRPVHIYNQSGFCKVPKHA